MSLIEKEISQSGSLFLAGSKNKATVDLDVYQQGTKEFVNLPLDALPKNVPLPIDIYLHFQGRLILFRKAGDTLTPARAAELETHNVRSLYVKQQILESVVSFLSGIAEAEVAHSMSGAAAIRSLLLTYNRFLETNKKFRKEHLDALGTLAGKLALIVDKNRQHAKQLLVKYEDPSLYLINHTINVAIYAVVIGIKQGIPNRDLSNLALAALLHNVGYFCLDSSVLYRPSPLTVQERSVLNHHTVLGAKLLESVRAPREAIITALQHHEREDGEGYPHCLVGRDLHPFSKICSIADVYDALTSVRPHRVLPLSPADAIREMLGTGNGKFDPKLLSL